MKDLRLIKITANYPTGPMEIIRLRVDGFTFDWSRQGLLLNEFENSDFAMASYEAECSMGALRSVVIAFANL